MLMRTPWNRPGLLVIGLLVLLAGPAVAQVDYSFDVRAPLIDGDLLLNGAPMPGVNDGGLGMIGLTNGDGHETEFTSTLPGAYGPLRFIADEYASTYRLDYSTGGLPLNSTSVFGTPVDVEANESIDLELEAPVVRFEFSMNGSPFPVIPGNAAAFLLRDLVSGSEFRIGFANSGAVDVQVLPGTYEVIYSHIVGTAYPQNEHAVVGEKIEIVGAQLFEIDVEAFAQTIEATLNGQPFPTSDYETGVIRLHDFEGGDSVSFGPTHLGPATRLVLAGTYDASFSRTVGGNVVPRNLFSVFARDVEIDAPAEPGMVQLDTVDVSAVEVGLELSLDGEAFPVDDYEFGRIYLVDPSGAELHVATTHLPGPAVVRITPGTYDVFYRRVLGGAVVPLNSNVRVARGVQVLSDGDLEIQVQSHIADFHFTLNGQPFPNDDYERARFHLVGEAEGDRIFLGESDTGTVPRRVATGSYRVEYDRVLGGNVVPRNRNYLTAEEFEIDSDFATEVNFDASLATGAFYLNGGAFPADPDQTGDLVLRDPRGGETVLGPTHAGTVLPVRAIEGLYAVDYEWRTGDQVPRNTRHRLGYVRVPEPGFTMALGVGAGAAVLLARRRRSAGCRGEAPLDSHHSLIANEA